MNIDAADIGSAYPRDWFDRRLSKACDAFPFATLGPVMQPFCNDQGAIARHWPWVAMAAYGYQNRRSEDLGAVDLSPAQFRKLLATITRHARHLDAALQQLDRAVDGALANENRPKFVGFSRAQRQVINAFGADPGGGRWDPDARPNYIDWCLRLGPVADHAEQGAGDLAGDAQVSLGAGPRLHGVHSLVHLLAAVWQSMNNRPPTAERVQKKSGDQNDESPAFVRFVQAVSSAAGGAQPTRSMIKTALTHQ